ncbi:MAG: carboxymuconolactone decarboxylase family protein [Balneolaceae bacterium]|nr:carboxymuconolactone decarboxylase family protein [Balneolaceae bacterium]
MTKRHETRKDRYTNTIRCTDRRHTSEQLYRGSTLESNLLELVKLRTSQINGCSTCVEIHEQDAEAAGVNSRRRKGLSGWTEFPFYNDRERVALGLAELLTRIPGQKITEDIYQLAGEHFDQEDLSTLTTVIHTINNWNSERNNKTA